MEKYKCEMQMVNFMGTELHETEFYQCDLRKADFRDATGYKVDILGSRLKDAKFSLQIIMMCHLIPMKQE